MPNDPPPDPDTPDEDPLIGDLIDTEDDSDYPLGPDELGFYILPGNTGLILAALKTGRTTFTPRHTIMGKGVAYVRPFDTTLPVRPIEVEFENNKCCLEIHNSSYSTVEFLFGNEIAYFDARSKSLVQANNSKHFPIDQYLHDRVTPATLSPKPIAYDKPIHPSEMPRISKCTDMITDDTNVPTKDDKYP